MVNAVVLLLPCYGSFAAAISTQQLAQDLEVPLLGTQPGERATTPQYLAQVPAASSRRRLHEDIEQCDGYFTTWHDITSEGHSPRSVDLGDFDGDGDLDVLSGSFYYGGRVAWYENLNGAGDFSGPQRIIASLGRGTVNVVAADLDGDGDLDVLATSGWGTPKIVWFENLGGVGNFSGPERVVTATEADGPTSLTAADLDGDADLDVLVSLGWTYPNRVVWFENSNGAGDFLEPQRVIANQTDFNQTDTLNSVAAADLDGDGDLDVLLSSEHRVAWYENLEGAGDFSGGANFISKEVIGAYSVATGDLDGDGDLDALSVSVYDNKIAWYENLDGTGNFSAQRIITTQANDTRSVAVADLDGDGDLDIVIGLSTWSGIYWFENLNGAGDFSRHSHYCRGAIRFSIKVGDIDGDGDLDVVRGSDGARLGWSENVYKPTPTSQPTREPTTTQLDDGDFLGPPRVITTQADGAISVVSADLDGDGDLDVLSTSDNDYKVAWYENLGGVGNFSGPQRIITTLAKIDTSVSTADLDGDGDLDVLTASTFDEKIAWYENLDGAGDFSGPERIITTLGHPARSVAAADLDGDGDIDVLYASAGDEIAWYENLDGASNFTGPRHLITTQVAYPRSITAADVDGDGDLDVLSASAYDDKIAWYENVDGAGDFSGPQRVITTQAREAGIVAVADFDGDGDLDVLSAPWYEDKIAWYENVDGSGNFSGPQREITTEFNFVASVTAVDLDCDGDVDVLLASWNDEKIAWYENMDGAGNFGGQQRVLAMQLDSDNSVTAADLDGDGQVDVLSASYSEDKIAWYKNQCVPTTVESAPEPESDTKPQPAPGSKTP